jgi:hypothetical protein
MTNHKQTGIPDEKPDLPDQWHRGIRLLHIAHAKAAARFRRRGRLFGVPVIVLTTVVGTSIFATISEQAISENWKIAAGLMSGLAAILSALQTFLDYGVLAEKHKLASIAFGALRRDLERALDADSLDGGTREQIMEKIKDRWTEIEREAPIVPDNLHRKAAKQVGASQAQDD